MNERNTKMSSFLNLFFCALYGQTIEVDSVCCKLGQSPVLYPSRWLLTLRGICRCSSAAGGDLLSVDEAGAAAIAMSSVARAALARDPL